jgi:hypothetical protein
MNSGQVLSFLRRPSSCDWTQQELAEFYRVEDVLLQGGFAVTTDRGVSDEGDPWFVVCRADTEEVIAHFARIDREYVIVSNLYPGAARGYDFRALVREMLDSHPLTLPIRRSQGQKVLLHPATLLVALLASAYIVSSEKDLSTEGHHKSTSIASLLIEKFSIFAAAILAATWLENQADSALNSFENGPLFHLFHDEKAAVAAAHDVAPLDTISQNSPSTDVGGHRSDQINQVVGLTAKPEDAAGQDNTLKAINCINPTHNPSENTADATTPPPDHANDDQASFGPATGAHNDCTNLVGLTNLQTPIAAGTIAAASSQVSTEGSQGNSLDSAVITTDAYHLTASEISGFSVPTVLLSIAPVPVNVALQQAFIQVGLGSALTHDVSTASSDGALALGTNNALSNATAHPAASTGNPGPAVVSSPVAAPNASSTVVQAVEQFLESTPSAEVTLSGANVVIIDTNVSDAKSPNFGVMTWDMSDGSTLSIVGILHSNLHAVSA